MGTYKRLAQGKRFMSCHDLKTGKYFSMMGNSEHGVGWNSIFRSCIALEGLRAHARRSPSWNSENNSKNLLAAHESFVVRASVRSREKLSIITICSLVSLMRPSSKIDPKYF